MPETAPGTLGIHCLLICANEAFCVMDQELRHVTNQMPDYDAFIASLQTQPPTGEGGLVLPFTSSSECVRLTDSVRSWLLQNVQVVMMAWPPLSSQCPTSTRGHTEQDFSIYVGTGIIYVCVWRRELIFWLCLLSPISVSLM